MKSKTLYCNYVYFIIQINKTIYRFVYKVKKAVLQLSAFYIVPIMLSDSLNKAHDCALIKVLTARWNDGS